MFQDVGMNSHKLIKGQALNPEQIVKFVKGLEEEDFVFVVL